MANVSKLQKSSQRSTLGEPPTLEEASANLAQPEAAPATRKRVMDGRTARRTNRTIQFATRVTPEWDERIRTVAQRDGLLLVEVLEQALDCYESTREPSS